MQDDERARYARAILDNEVFADICAEIEQEAIDGVRKAASSEELLAARAKLLTVDAITKRLKALVANHEYTKSRPARAPLA
jgi:hypothetical protein